MKKIVKMVIGMCLGVLLVGCQSVDQISRQNELAVLLIKDLGVYFQDAASQINLNEYSSSLLEHELLIEQETHSQILKGDRVVYQANLMHPSSGIRQVIAEYSEAYELLGIKIQYDTTEGSLQKIDELQLCETFIEEYKLASTYSYLDKLEKNNISVYSFKVSENDRLKIYVDSNLNRVTGFLRYDGVDL